MTSGIQSLRERAATKAKEVRDLVETNKDKWDKDLQAKYDAGMSEFEEIKASIGRMEKADALLNEETDFEKIKDVSARKGIKTDNLYNKWLRGGDRALSAEDWKTVRATMSTTTTTEGGFTVQTEVAKSVVDALKAYGGMRSVSTVIQTSKGNDISFPVSDGTAEVGEIIAQNTTATAADPAFTAVTHSIYKYSSKIVAVPFELLQDSEIDVEQFVRNRLITRLGRITNTHFTTGDGSSKPRGIVTASALGKTGTTGQTLTVIFDDLVDLVHSVDPAYREAGKCGFMMNDSSLKVIRKLKDSQNRPVFMPGYEGLGGAMKDSLLGYNITINQDVATMAASAKSILFGDFNNYIIRDVMDVTLFRFDDSAYAKLGQVGFLAWMRSGGNLVDSSGASVKHYINSAT